MKILPHKALSNHDIERALKDEKIKIVQYKDIRRFKTLEELFSGVDAVILLYNSSDTYGHWTVLVKIKGKNMICYHDSYGLKIDTHSGNYVPQNENLRNNNSESSRYLSQLIIDFMKKHPEIDFRYNNYKFQGKGSDNESCGYHVVHRVKRRDLDEDEYYKLFKNVKNTDNAIILLTQKYLE